MWYSCAVLNGRSYIVSWEDWGTDSSKLDILIDVMYQDGTAIFTAMDGSSDDVDVFFTANRTGTVLLRVYPCTSGKTGQFTVTFTLQ